MKLIIFSLVLPCFLACGQIEHSKNLDFFKGTEAYDLAKACEKQDLIRIEKIVKKNPGLMEFRNSESGSNVLSMCLYIDKFESFRKLVDLGANPNSINPIDSQSVLMKACKYFGDWRIDNRYAELLLKHGANPNYVIENDFTSNGMHYMSAAPLHKACSVSLDLVKLLIDYSADPFKKLGEKQRTAFSEAVASRNIDIIYYFIDSIKIDVNQPMIVRKNDSLFIQDYIHRFMPNNPNSEGYIKKQKLIKYLESKGVDFKNYRYKP